MATPTFGARVVVDLTVATIVRSIDPTDYDDCLAHLDTREKRTTFAETLYNALAPSLTNHPYSTQAYIAFAVTCKLYQALKRETKTL
jgi:hypothetical protein